MKLTTGTWIGTDLSDEAFADLARQMLGRGEVALLRNVLVAAEQYRTFWPTVAGQMLLVDILHLLLETLNGAVADDVAQVLAAMNACPPHLAGQAHDLLVAALFGEAAMGDPAELDDAAVLCLVILTGASGRREAVGPFLDAAKAGRVDAFFLPPATQIQEHYAGSHVAEALKPKLVIWDLDDTLWQGTLADGDEPVLNERRADVVRALNRHGIVSAICSKNDHATVQAKLAAFGLWNEFVFPRIAFVPKGAVVKRMIADMQLRPANVLFIDDNPHNLREVADAVPGITVVDATSPGCDVLLARLVDDHAHVAKSRVADYRVLEAKLSEREENALSDEDFLRRSGIQATFAHRMDNLDFADRIEELINRSNQLNYTASRIRPGVMRQRIQDIDTYEVLSAFVWDKYGYYGLVGVIVYNFRTHVVEHFAFSCRIMHMGVEDYLIRRLEEQGHGIDPAQFCKPLPPQSADAITAVPFSDPAVRTRVLAEEAPRDWSRVRMRIMADCQSGAFHHYSRFRDEADFDNNPRLFSLPMMKTGAYREQEFPRFLVYTAATDYIDWRWEKLCPIIDVDVFRECVDLFVDMVVKGDRKCLLFLPPQGLSPKMYELHRGCVPARSRELHPVLNKYWRGVAARYPDHFTLIELKAVLGQDEMVHAHHYVPSALQRMSGMIDDWYAGHEAVDAPPVDEAA